MPSTVIPARSASSLAWRDRAVGAHAVAPQPPGLRQLEQARERAVIGEQQQAFGVEIQPADADEAGQVRRQILKDGRPALRVGARGHEAARLVIEEEPRALARRQRFAVDADAVARRHVERGRADDRAVDRDAASGDPVLGLAAGSQAGARDRLGDAFTAVVVALVYRVMRVHLGHAEPVPGVAPFVEVYKGVRPGTRRARR